MSEPEELILEGAHLATRVARDLWRRYAPAPAAHVVTLDSLRDRLELFTTALFGTTIAITAAEPPAPPTWLSRLAHHDRPSRQQRIVLSGTDGRRVYLPPSLDLKGSAEDTRAVYRLLAVQQSARLVRGTARVFGRIPDRQTQDWFLCAEGDAIDRWIATHVPGLADVLSAARAEALARRIRAGAPAGANAMVERHLRGLLATNPADRHSGTSGAFASTGLDVEGAFAWANSAAARHRVSARYRRIEPVWPWGSILEPSGPIRTSQPEGHEAEHPSPDARARVAEMRRRPRARQAEEDEDDERPGTWVVRTDEPQESVEDPFGLQRPADQDKNADPEGLADSLADLPEARMVSTPERPREILRSGDEPERIEHARSLPPRRLGFAYPEWDYRIAGYRDRGAIVHELPALLGDADWVKAALARHARLVKRMRARFERLRPRRVRQDRQTDGSDIDISAYVVAAADLRAGASVDARMYVSVRPARRELAVALLVDTSASTDAWVSGNRRIVDVEKEALVVVCEALDALGDRYGIYAFSGESAGDVTVSTLKRFEERAGLTVQRRIAALDSNRYTRLGAAIRHVTSVLCREPAAQRLLLILSDGKPNDVDLYEGRYGVEDSRQAIAEARRQRVTPFCLTVDRHAPRYAVRIFGPTGFAVLHRAEQLPSVLIEVLRQLIRA